MTKLTVEQLKEIVESTRGWSFEQHIEHVDSTQRDVERDYDLEHERFETVHFGYAVVTSRHTSGVTLQYLEAWEYVEGQEGSLSVDLDTQEDPVWTLGEAIVVDGDGEVLDRVEIEEVLDTYFFKAPEFTKINYNAL